MKKLKLAIIGQGRSGRGIHGDFYKSENNIWYDVAAVVELDPERRERALAEYPGCTVYEDYRELFERDDIDLAVNASFSEMHYPITKDLLCHGFNVLCEKPLARNYYEACDLINTAKAHNVTLAAFQQTFLAPFYKKAKEVADSGILGNIKQVSICYNGFARRWDWQTLQAKMAGCVFNTGPHPIGMALGFLDFDELARVEYSKIDLALASGDAEDYAKIIMSAPGKPVIDVEISPCDAFKPHTLKIQGDHGTFLCTTGDYKMKYIVDGENPERPVIWEPLEKEDGTPSYCGETLITHVEEGKIGGSAFDVAVVDFYHMLYDTLTTGAPLLVPIENIAKIVQVIEKVHADNPMPVKY
ncbi:MAG: Gfo/Idh/MocA family oxidoreductase [Clostridia bacterium]|nr:Gfo/Idh/MocA family oxidoreductase [Clostridia bacterium]